MICFIALGVRARGAHFQTWRSIFLPVVGYVSQGVDDSSARPSEHHSTIYRPRRWDPSFRRLGAIHQMDNSIPYHYRHPRRHLSKTITCFYTLFQKKLNRTFCCSNSVRIHEGKMLNYHMQMR